MKSFFAIGIAALLLGLGATAIATEGSYREVGWDELLPEGTPELVVDHSQPMDQVQPLFGDVPQLPTGIVAELNNQKIKIPGFIVPLDVSGDDISSFLLVPYFGACIHLPPPPPNQIVYVMFEKPVQVESIWEPVWVTGTMMAEGHRSNIGEAGYTLLGNDVEIYEY
ncbi:MAG: DUF3299 domain-containing protein [Pseudomonadota bacterium]